jgi:uncharacterized sulfatase
MKAQLLLLFGAIVLVLGIKSLHAATSPNLITIVTDDQAIWTLGCYGNRECPTPNMDHLSREGARFTNAFVTTPVCSPSRASFLTGRYGTELGVTDWINKPEMEAGVGLPDVPTWPAVLQKNGYTTALIGKWHLGDKPQFHPTKHGFDHFFGFLGGGESPMDPNLEKDGKLQQISGPISDLLTDDAIAFVEKNAGAGKRFAMCLMYREPHQPYTPMPKEDAASVADLDPTIPNAPLLDPKVTKEWTREYYASIHAADRNIGRLLAKLDELKLADNTIVLFSSDHGYCIGQHTVYTKGNGVWIAGGVSGPRRPNMFEENIRVPLIIRWPGVTKPGSEIAETVTLLDTFPTVLGMLDIKSDDTAKQHGIDYSPLLRGQSIPRREFLYGEYDMHNYTFASMRMIRTDEWKLVRFQLVNMQNELYDLKNDPGETKNLYEKPAGRKMRDELQSKLTAYQESIHDPMLTNPLNTPGVGGTVHAK